MRNLPARPAPARASRRLDSASQPIQSTAVVVLDPNASGGFSRERLAAQLRRRLAASPGLCRTLDPTGRIGLPPDVRDHLFPVIPTEAVSERALCRLVGELSVRPLARSRPLWNLYTIEGLCGGLVALVLVVDVSLADPPGCMRLLSRLLGLGPAHERREDRAASPANADLDPASNEQRGPSGVRAEPSTTLHVGDDAARPDAPASRRWGGALTRSRASAYARSHRAAIDVVRRAFGGTREDVTLAACTRALRRHFQAHGDPVTQPLVAALPTGCRADDHDGGFLRRVRLPVQIQDPVDQLRMVQSETYRARAAERERAIRWLARPGEIADPERRTGEDPPRRADPTGVRPAHDLVFSYLAGPSRSVYMDGARVVGMHPHGPLLGGAALDIRVLVYGDSIDFGLMVCPDLVPDAVEIAIGIDSAVADLVKRSFEER